MVPLADSCIFPHILAAALQSTTQQQQHDESHARNLTLLHCCLPTVAANITLSFSYPVDLAMLAKALKVAGPGSAGQTITISPCTTALPPLWPIIFTANGLQGPAGAVDTSPADQLQLNSTCAVVKIVPGLAAGASAVLRLPAGAKYSTVAGPIVLDTDVQVTSGVVPASFAGALGLDTAVKDCPFYCTVLVAFNHHLLVAWQLLQAKPKLTSWLLLHLRPYRYMASVPSASL